MRNPARTRVLTISLCLVGIGLAVPSVLAAPGPAGSDAPGPEATEVQEPHGAMIAPSHSIGQVPFTSGRGRPSREAWDDPPINASEFSQVAPAVATYARQRARTARKGDGKVRAYAAHTVVCLAYASTTRGNLRYVAHGRVDCPSAVDMLSAKACIDGWTPTIGNDGYWTRLGCSEWKTRTATSTVIADGYGRSCTNGRIYRAVAAASAFHHTTAYGEDKAPSHPCGHY